MLVMSRVLVGALDRAAFLPQSPCPYLCQRWGSYFVAMQSGSISSSVDGLSYQFVCTSSSHCLLSYTNSHYACTLVPFMPVALFALFVVLLEVPAQTLCCTISGGNTMFPICLVALFSLLCSILVATSLQSIGLPPPQPQPEGFTRSFMLPKL